MKLMLIIATTGLFGSAAAAPAMAQDSSMSPMNQSSMSTGKGSEMRHAARADKERMAAGKEAAAAKRSHYRGKHKMAARHHKMAAAHDRAAAAAQDKAAMSATAPK